MEVSSNAPSPEELMIANQNLDALLEHIKSMKKEYRTLLRMRYFEDLSLKEIETILEEPQTTIRVKLFRAKKVLANLINRDAN
jgi:RNA polymerase sigma-70 factor (ECF subfamily)